MSVEFKSQTIRRRIKITFIVTICFIALMAIGYGINIFELKSDLTVIEDYYILTNNVLELRRFEKNLIFDLGKTSYNHDQVLYYLDAIQNNSIRLAEKITHTVGEQDYLRFNRDMGKYKEYLADGKIAKYDVTSIRAIGQSMVSFSENLVALKRKEIHTTLHNTLVGFLIFPVGGFIVVLVVFFLQTKSVLHRLAFIQNSTKKLTTGHWEPINDETAREDEISNLVEATFVSSLSESFAVCA